MWILECFLRVSFASMPKLKNIKFRRWPLRNSALVEAETHCEAVGWPAELCQVWCLSRLHRPEHAVTSCLMILAVEKINTFLFFFSLLLDHYYSMSLILSFHSAKPLSSIKAEFLYPIGHFIIKVPWVLKSILEITQLNSNYLVMRNKCKVNSLMELTSTYYSEIGLSLKQ